MNLNNIKKEEDKAEFDLICFFNKRASFSSIKSIFFHPMNQHQTKEKLLVISQIQIWDMKKNAGKAVMDKTFQKFGSQYDLTIIAPGDVIQYGSSKFYPLKSTIEDKIGKIYLIGHLFRYFAFYLFYLDVKKIIEKNGLNPDIIYLVGYYAAFAGSKIYKNKKFTINRYYGVAWNEKTFHTLKDRVKMIVRKYCFRHFAQLIILTNDGTKGDLFFKKIGYQGNQFYFLKNGIEMDYALESDFKTKFILKHNLPNDVLLLLTVSRLAAWKKVERAIEALVAIKEKVPNAVLVIVGSGETSESLKNLAVQLNVQDHVIFAGAISHDVLPNFYQMTDIFLSLYDYSNAGNPLFEAMLHRKAIVTINNGDTLDFISHEAAKIIDDFDAAQLVEATLQLLENEELRTQLGNKAHALLRQNFQSWDERIQTEVNIINNQYHHYLESKEC